MRQAVIDRILVDKLSTTSVAQAMERDFLLKLSTGFLYDCSEYAIRKFNGAEFRAKVLSEFSGSLCVDEIHLGDRVVLLASDPVSDNPVACALVSKNDGPHMLRFLQNLKNLRYLDYPVSVRSRVRTNNHVERCNRVLRYLEKVRYKWRRRRTIVRHILLQFENWLKRKENKAEMAV